MAKVDRSEKIGQEENADNPTDVELIDEFRDALIGVNRQVDGKTIPVYSYI